MAAATRPRGIASRRRLLEAAAAELVERDGDLEVAAVAARAGTSVGLIYRHYGSKAGLLGAVIDDFYDRFDAEVIAPALRAEGADWGARERLRT